MLIQRSGFAPHARGKKFFYGVFGILLLVFLGGWFFGGISTSSRQALLEISLPTELDFCGESVPLDQFYVEEAWQREFLIALGQDYQNILYLKRAPKYLPFIEAELAKRDLPEDLKYVAIAESGLVEGATSSAGAAGIWQFVPETARNYELVVNDEIDERHHFEKATSAALTYLNKLHTDFGNWTLAVAAYNVGENGLARRLLEQKVNDYYALELPTETARYIFRILAIKEIFEHAERYGYTLSDADYFSWPSLRIKTVGALDDLVNFSRGNQTNLRTLRELNPWITGKTLPSGEWQVRMEESLGQ